jgi:hypothetical protein
VVESRACVYGDVTTGKKIAVEPSIAVGVGETAEGAGVDVGDGVTVGVGVHVDGGGRITVAVGVHVGGGVTVPVGVGVWVGVGVSVGAASNRISPFWVFTGSRASPPELAKLKTVTLRGVVIPTAAVPVAIQEISTRATGALAGADTLETVSRAKRTASGVPSPLLS